MVTPFLSYFIDNKGTAKLIKCINQTIGDTKSDSSLKMIQMKILASIY